MSNKYFQVRYSQVNQDLLLGELKKRYKLIEPISCQLFKKGMNDIYIVKAAQQVYFLRISLTDMHEQRDYEEEISVINSLSENGINLAVPICCEDGSFVWSINAPEGIRYAVLFLEAEKSPSNDKVKMGHHADLMKRNEGCGWYNDEYFDFHIGVFKLWYKRFM